MSTITQGHQAIPNVSVVSFLPEYGTAFITMGGQLGVVRPLMND